MSDITCSYAKCPECGTELLSMSGQEVQALHDLIEERLGPLRVAYADLFAALRARVQACECQDKARSYETCELCVQDKKLLGKGE